MCTFLLFLQLNFVQNFQCTHLIAVSPTSQALTDTNIYILGASDGGWGGAAARGSGCSTIGELAAVCMTN